MANLSLMEKATQFSRSGQDLSGVSDLSPAFISFGGEDSSSWAATRPSSAFLDPDERDVRVTSNPSTFELDALGSPPGLSDPDPVKIEVEEPGRDDADKKGSSSAVGGSRESDFLSGHTPEVARAELLIEEIVILIRLSRFSPSVPQALMQSRPACEMVNAYGLSQSDMTPSWANGALVLVPGLRKEDLNRSHPTLELKNSEVLVLKASESALLEKLQVIPESKRPDVRQRTELLLRREFASSAACSSTVPPSVNGQVEATANEPMSQASLRTPPPGSGPAKVMVPEYSTEINNWEPVKIDLGGALEAPVSGQARLTGVGTTGIYDPDRLCRTHVLGVTQRELRRDDIKPRAAKPTDAVRPSPSKGSTKSSSKTHFEATPQRERLVLKAVERLVHEGRHAELVMIAKTVREEDSAMDRNGVRSVLKGLVYKKALQLVKDSPGTFEVSLIGQEPRPTINEDRVNTLADVIAAGIKEKNEEFLVNEDHAITSRTLLGDHYRRVFERTKDAKLHEFFKDSRDGDLYESLRRLEEKGYFVTTPKKSPQGRFYKTSENFKRPVEKSESWYRMRNNVRQLLLSKNGIPVSRLKAMYYTQYHELLDHEAFGYVKFMDLLKDENLARLVSDGSHHTAKPAEPIFEDHRFGHFGGPHPEPIWL